MLHFSLSRNNLLRMSLITLCLVLSPAFSQQLGGVDFVVPEKDRKAILSMAGEFQVSFSFEETMALSSKYEISPIYTETAAELVEVIEDRGDYISLQHILVVNDGFEDIVVKHWRQDWTFQDQEILEYAGGNSWELRRVPLEKVKGAWTQAVYQVTDMPRYESIGRWVHTGTFSSWTSADTWRPLPRREKKKHKEYDVLVTQNTHTVTPQGWMHSQRSRKLVLDEEGKPEEVIALERGLNMYMHTNADYPIDVDLQIARDYWERTSHYWASVRKGWNNAFSGHVNINIAAAVSGEPLAKIVNASASAVAINPEKLGLESQKIDAVILKAVSASGR